MDFYRRAERLMAMDDATWWRHANPWSGSGTIRAYSRSLRDLTAGCNAVFGMLLTMLPEIWFVDRMVWIFHDWR
ncbi:hypothetical protein [Roseovarius sp. ZX-A-9]|uniref:hypothetical protein n=1 Tax=Roseovarius sp. ZX-A-9 TaxID=3014783 RepID=UPI00232B18A4|nr:hypothetical protein [Roseovarius sp. ZX-A-9]